MTKNKLSSGDRALLARLVETYGASAVQSATAQLAKPRRKAGRKSYTDGSDESVWLAVEMRRRQMNDTASRSTSNVCELVAKDWRLHSVGTPSAKRVANIHSDVERCRTTDPALAAQLDAHLAQIIALMESEPGGVILPARFKPSQK